MNGTIYKVSSVSDILDVMAESETNFDLDFHKKLLKTNGHLYASHFRPGEIWEEEVFVCPKCVHATLISTDPNDEIINNNHYCKYCHNDWSLDSNYGWVAK